MFNNVYGRNGSYVTAGQQDYAERMNQIQTQKEAYYKKVGVAPGVPTEKGAYGDPENTGVGYNAVLTELGNHDVPQGWIQTPRPNTTPGTTPGAPVSWNDPSNPDDPQAGYGYIPNDTTREETFFYHSDHLGSTSYITDDKANITQYDAYLPYGELLVDEHSSSEDLPYKFNGKQFDEETGLYYYGARCMNPKTSLWYGVDALAEKYVSTGCYVYCIDNPVKFIDSDGNDIILIVWASHDGRIGHAGIAISNYKEVKSKVKVNGRWTTQVRMVQDGTYTYRDLWPGGEGAGKQNFDKDLPAVYNNRKVTLSNILNSDVTGLEESAPDGVVKISSNHNVDQRIQKKLDAYELENPSYNALTNNCSDYAEAALEEAVHKELPVDEKLSSKIKATTPNQVFKASRRIRGNHVLKNPGSKINNSFIHAVSGGGIKQKLAEKTLDR